MFVLMSSNWVKKKRRIKHFISWLFVSKLDFEFFLSILCTSFIFNYNIETFWLHPLHFCFLYVFIIFFFFFFGMNISYFLYKCFQNVFYYCMRNLYTICRNSSWKFLRLETFLFLLWLKNDKMWLFMFIH